MRRSFLGRVIPAALTAAGVAIPSVTAALVMLHSVSSGSASRSTLPPSSSGSVAAVVTPTPKPAANASPRPARGATRTVAGPIIDDRYGQVQATLTLSGSKIADVSIAAPMDDPRSAGINQQAVPLLRSETLQAQSAHVNVVSGATITSDAYVQSLQGALQTAVL